MWTYNNELYHYGVLGMKWGVRKQPQSTGSRSSGIKIIGGKKNKKLNPEDQVAYKYNKPGESGWVGAGRAIKAKVSKKSNKLSTAKKIAIGAALVGGTAVALKYRSTLVKSLSKRMTAQGEEYIKSAWHIQDLNRGSLGDSLSKSLSKKAEDLYEKGWQYKDRAHKKDFTASELIKEARTRSSEKYFAKVSAKAAKKEARIAPKKTAANKLKNAQDAYLDKNMASAKSKNTLNVTYTRPDRSNRRVSANIKRGPSTSRKIDEKAKTRTWTKYQANTYKKGSYISAIGTSGARNSRFYNELNRQSPALKRDVDKVWQGSNKGDTLYSPTYPKLKKKKRLK